MSITRLVALCAALFVNVASAHDSRPIFVQIDQHDDGQVLVSWKVPDSVLPENAPEVVLIGGCSAARSPAEASGTEKSREEKSRDEKSESEVAIVRVRRLQGLRWYACEQGGVPVSIALDFPGAAPSLTTLVRVEWPDGSAQTIHAAPGTSDIPLPPQALVGSIFQHYLVLGIEHILQGYDHLLFVACLVLLAGTLKRIVLAVTGFTAAHSITLGAAALGYVSVPVPPVEATIALSIMFLAAELARDRRDTLVWRCPLLVAGLFGLLHGFGFASVLGDIGLPDHEVVLALLSFNLGVEIGQVCFVLLLLSLLLLVSRIWTERVGKGLPARIAAYPIGALAMFWTIERMLLFG